ncbi:MAG: DNA-binding/iron metalloprotein/AP endonuclease, O-sialoglycoprotein endopeptidase [Patescibacteria group bacterium]|jgi:N6-L-threonylcarbamoyladenine synthase|nr:DNA-binding/iron metalloprotein/AP endonuclease, O-sialoglycoprotein endopeptidase [Patescibacteria group bacterium]
MTHIPLLILAIDTSCDDTSAAVCDGRKVLSNVVSSQVRYHNKFGGVVPFLAQRLHKERIDSVVELAIQRSGYSWKDIEAVAVTEGPGLAPALQVGIEKAKHLCIDHNLPLYAINHMAGHIASCFAITGSKVPSIELPALALLVSGNHTELVPLERFGSFSVIGHTLDDSVGEAYDKVGRMLGFGYPGGKIVAKMADAGDPSVYKLPIPMQKSGDLNFSYSGLKNAVRLLIYEVKGGTHTHTMEKHEIENICASFQEVAQASLIQKLERALKERPEIKSILVAGGVSSNAVLRRKVRSLAGRYDLTVHVPPRQNLCGDNAAMIGVAAFLGIGAGQKPVKHEELDRKPALSL